MSLDAITFKVPNYVLVEGHPIPNRYAVLGKHINTAIDLLQAANPAHSIESIGDTYIRETILDTGTPLRDWKRVPTEGYTHFTILCVK